MHIKKKANPLPADIQKFIDESEHGVVYFSLGGNLSPSVSSLIFYLVMVFTSHTFFNLHQVMPIEKQQAITKSLSQLKERVLWKWDDLNAKVDPKKFLVKKWFPQDDGDFSRFYNLTILKRLIDSSRQPEGESFHHSRRTSGWNGSNLLCETTRYDSNFRRSKT